MKKIKVTFWLAVISGALAIYGLLGEAWNIARLGRMSAFPGEIILVAVIIFLTAGAWFRRLILKERR